jgi:hypothetical protein
VSRDFPLLVFFINQPHIQQINRLNLINRPKPFRIWLRIRRDNRFESRQNRIQRGHMYISAWSMTPLKRFQRGHWQSWNSNIVDFLGEYEAIGETALGRESGTRGPWWGWLMKKSEGRKTRATVPFRSKFYGRVRIFIVCRFSVVFYS